MKYEEVMKKLEEIKVDAYNNLSSGEEESELQVESSTEEPNEEPAGGEEIKVKVDKKSNELASKISELDNKISKIYSIKYI